MIRLLKVRVKGKKKKNDQNFFKKNISIVNREKRRSTLKWGDDKTALKQTSSFCILQKELANEI